MQYRSFILLSDIPNEPEQYYSDGDSWCPNFWLYDSWWSCTCIFELLSTLYFIDTFLERNSSRWVWNIFHCVRYQPCLIDFTILRSLDNHKSWDFRSGNLPLGVEIVGEYSFVLQRDGSSALLLPPSTYINIHSDATTATCIDAYSILIDVLMESLPKDSLSIVHTNGIITTSYPIS